jgi:hypothetical protein
VGNIQVQIAGRAAPVTFKVTVVRVIVANPDAANNGPFTKGKIRHAPVDDEMELTVNGITREQRGKFILAGSALTPALAWRADVALAAPDGNPQAVQDINVGFIQHVYVVAARVNFPGNKTLTASIDGQTYLDTSNNAVLRPWFNIHSVLRGAAIKDKDAQAKSSDWPALKYPVDYRPPGGALVTATSISYEIIFVLDIAAHNRDDLDVYSREASMVWVVNGSGTLQKTADGEDLTWKPAKGSGIAVMTQTTDGPG